MAAFVVLATVLAMMATTNRWIEFVQHRLDQSRSAQVAQAAAEPDARQSPSDAARLTFDHLWQQLRWHIFVSWLIVLVIHLSYWTLLAQDLVFSKHIEQIRAGTLLVPAALVWAYFLSAFSPSHATSIAVFAGVYLVLLLDELGAEHSRKFRLQGSSRRATIWMCIDLVLVGGLVLCLVDYMFWDHSRQMGQTQPLIDRAYLLTLSVKDAIIGVNLLGYCFAFILSREIDRSSANLLYRGFMKAVITPVPENIDTPPALGPAATVDVEKTGDDAEKNAAADRERPHADPAALPQASTHHGVPADQPASSAALSDRISRLGEKLKKGGKLVVVDFGCCDSRRALPHARVPEDPTRSDRHLDRHRV